MRTAVSSSAEDRTTPPGVRGENTASRGTMYLGQLPKLCCTRTEKPDASTLSTTPFMRLRRLVCGSMPRNPSERPGATTSGSPGKGKAFTVSESEVASMNPGGPQSTEAQGWPESSTDPTTTNGSCSKNSRCCSSM